MTLGKRTLNILQDLGAADAARIIQNHEWKLCNISVDDASVTIIESELILAIETSFDEFLAINLTGPDFVGSIRKHHYHYPRAIIPCQDTDEHPYDDTLLTGIITRYMNHEFSLQSADYSVSETYYAGQQTNHTSKHLTRTLHQYVACISSKKIPTSKSFDGNVRHWNKAARGQFYELLPRRPKPS